jgi:hypothetical protein
VAADACGTSKNLQRKGLLAGAEPEFLECEILEATETFSTRVAFFWKNGMDHGMAAARSCSRNYRLTICFFLTLETDFASHRACNLRGGTAPLHPLFLLRPPVDFRENRIAVLNSAKASLRCFMSKSSGPEVLFWEIAIPYVRTRIRSRMEHGSTVPGTHQAAALSS